MIFPNHLSFSPRADKLLLKIASNECRQCEETTGAKFIYVYKGVVYKYTYILRMRRVKRPLKTRIEQTRISHSAKKSHLFPYSAAERPSARHPLNFITAGTTARRVKFNEARLSSSPETRGETRSSWVRTNKMKNRNKKIQGLLRVPRAMNVSPQVLPLAACTYVFYTYYLYANIINTRLSCRTSQHFRPLFLAWTVNIHTRMFIHHHHRSGSIITYYYIAVIVIYPSRTDIPHPVPVF